MLIRIAKWHGEVQIQRKVYQDIVAWLKPVHRNAYIAQCILRKKFFKLSMTGIQEMETLHAEWETQNRPKHLGQIIHNTK